MSGSFSITLDTTPPASPTLVINGGASITGVQEVIVELTTPSIDVTSMKLWGDVDEAADALVQSDEGDSAWQAWVPTYSVRLSSGSERKYLYARLRDDVLNVTVAFTDFIDLDEDLPVVTITTPVDNDRISKISGADEATFSWQCNQDFERYEVRVVSTTGSPYGAGVLLPTTNGSLNTNANGAFDDDTPITTTINGADLEAASPGDTNKIVKVFVRNADDVWSS